MNTRVLILALCPLLLAACGDAAEETAATPPPPPAVTAPAPAPPKAPEPQAQMTTELLPTGNSYPDAWVGEWAGPEGTSLKIDGRNGQYTLTITNLDGPRSFDGRADGDVIRFLRDGEASSIHVGDGTGTGMKWLEGKTNCLIVKLGEGYCKA